MGAREPVEMLSADALLADLWREFMAPPPVLTVTQWAERHRILSGKDSAEPGPYRVGRTPYAREPMDCLSAHSPVEEVVLMWGAQTSKTTIGSNWLGYLADLNPGPIMVVQPTLDMAKRYSRQRLVPMIEESPRLRVKIRENRSRDEANTTLLKEFPGGFLAIAGANSASGLRSMPVRDLFTDEEDGYPLDVDGEGDPVQLARARQSTFSRRKHLRTSTPTTKEFSRIEAAYLASDRCRYHVACPHCQGMQPLEWGAATEHGIKWDKDEAGRAIPATARYVCRHCGAEVLEHHKPGMLSAGSWVPDKPGAQAGKVRGFQLSSLYSPLGWLSWATLVEEWERAQEARRTGDTTLLRVFINTRLAETFEEQGDKADEHQLRRRAESYPLRTVPHGGLVVTAGVDTQGDRLEAYAWAWGRGEESWLVDHVVVYGDPSLPESEPGSPWASLTEWRRLPLMHAAGGRMVITATAVDSGGHHTDMVYRYAKRHATEHVLAVKGSSIPGRAIIGKPTPIEFNHHGKRVANGGLLWLVGTDTAKGLLYGRMQVKVAGPGYVHTCASLPGYVWEQLTAERIVTRYVKGHPRREWVKPAGRRNEALDCAVYAMAAAWHIGVQRHTELHWQRYESRVRQADLLTLTLDSAAAKINAVAHSKEATIHAATDAAGSSDAGPDAEVSRLSAPVEAVADQPTQPVMAAASAITADGRATARAPLRPMRRPRRTGWVNKW